jgi:transposase InsO family protein
MGDTLKSMFERLDSRFDVLTQVLEAVHLGSVLSARIDLRAPWALHFGRETGHRAGFHVIVDGSGWAMLELLALAYALLRAALRERAGLVAENLVLRHQLGVLTRPTRQRPRLRARDKLLWVLIRWLWRDWREHLVLVRPETVIGWHRRGWRLLWRWKSRARLGRPRLDAEARELIAVMSRENPLWGTERIRGELLKLGIVVSNRSIRRYRRQGPTGRPSQTWRTFLANHAGQIWAADRFTVQTLTFKTLYVFFVIAHGRWELLHVNVTASPTAAWTWRQLIEATPWGQRPRYLVRDRDAAFGSDFVPRARRLGIETLLSPIRAPRANAVAERVVRTFRNECLDHVIPVNERHLRSVLREFVGYYHAERPHRGLGLKPPHPAAGPATGRVRSRPVLGGLHHVYERAA